MMPMPPPMSGAPMNVPGGMPPPGMSPMGPGGPPVGAEMPQEMPGPQTGEPQGGAAKDMLVKVLQNVKKMAEKSGLDFLGLVKQADSGGAGGPLPPPPGAPA